MSLRGHRAGVSTRDTARFLIVRYGATLLALPAGGVRGIVTLAEAGTETHVAAVGIQYDRLDLSARLSLPADFSGPDARMVLYSHGTGQCALPVEEVLGLIDVDRQQLRPLPAQFRAAERVWFHGVVLYRDTVALVLNPSWLLGTGAKGAGELHPAVTVGERLAC